MIACTKCKEIKPRYRGHVTWCRECFLAYKRAWQKANRHKVIAYQRNTRGKNPEAHRKEVKRYRERHPEKRKAQDAVRYQVKMGNFPPADSMACDVCQEAQAQHWHHHKGYGREFKLDVIAVCTICHSEEHRQRN